MLPPRQAAQAVAPAGHGFMRAPPYQLCSPHPVLCLRAQFQPRLLRPLIAPWPPRRQENAAQCPRTVLLRGAVTALCCVSSNCQNLPTNECFALLPHAPPFSSPPLAPTVLPQRPAMALCDSSYVVCSSGCNSNLPPCPHFLFSSHVLLPVLPHWPRRSPTFPAAGCTSDKGSSTAAA